MPRRVLLTIALLGCNPYGSEAQPDTPVDSGVTVDASTIDDAGGSDAGGGDSGGNDSGSTPDGTACTLKLEEHFDTATPFGWTQKITSGTLSATDGLLNAGANAGASFARASLERALPGGLPKSVTLVFDVRFTNVSGPYVEGGCTLLARKSDGSYYSLFPYVSDGNVYVDDDAALGTQPQATLGGAVVQSLQETFIYRFRSELRDLTPTGARAIVAVENVTLIDRVVTFPTAMDGITVSCGGYAAASSTVNALIDEMALTTCE